MLRRLMTLLYAGWYTLVITLLSIFCSPLTSIASNSLDYQALPPFVTAGVPPLVMLVMGRNHKLYYEAYNDASDLNSDQILDVGYNPAIEYYGYFDSFKYYEYSSANSRFEPKGTTTDKKSPPGSYWSGDFLNYLTMSRMDCMRKVLYGGFRSVDTATETVLQRSYIPQDAHSWGKEYHSVRHDGYDIQDYTPLDLPKGGSRHLFVSTTLSDNGNPLFRVLENSVLRIWQWVAIEVPVAGDYGDDGTGRRLVTDNNTSGLAFDATESGSAGTPFASIGPDITVQVPAGDLTTGGTAGTVTDVGYGNPTNEEYPKAFDDNINTKWLTWGCGDAAFCPVWIQFLFNSPQRVIRYSITTGNDEEYRDPKIWTLQASNDGVAWIVIDTVEDGALPSARKTKKEFDCDNPPAAGENYTYYRLVITGRKSTGTCSGKQCLQITEIELIGEGDMTVADPHEPQKAFDDTIATEWLTTGDPASNTVYLGFQFNTAKSILSYSVMSGSTEARDPKTWILEASNDNLTWVQLDTRSDILFSTRQEKKSFTCATQPSQDYIYYRLRILEKRSSAVYGVAIAEVEMMESTEPIPATAILTDYIVRVKVCDVIVGVEPNSKLYPSGVYKPIGILQRYGEADRMYFGLLTGSYTNNLSGGVLRKNIRSIRDEINTNTGEFLYKDTSVQGIIKTIDTFRIVNFDYGSHSYNSNCGWITTRSLSQGECRMWGNPVAEMMYESLRYFAGLKSATSEFTYGTTSNNDNDLGLPKPNWLDPYTDSEDLNMNGTLDAGEDINGNGVLDGFSYCAKPFMLVLSDINPTYDSDQLPGSDFGSVSSSLSGLNVKTLADTISYAEGDGGTHFIGESGTYNGACTPKSIPGFGTVRGLCPEEPTKQGSYYSASVGYYGNNTDIHSTASHSQKVKTYAVGIASPLPRIEIAVGTKLITLVPFAKSVAGSSISASQGDFQPTNTIVDFFVEDISPTRGKFRINYEDVEQGADHDMDAIVEYVYQVVDAAGNPVTDPDQGEKVTISLNCIYAAGSIVQHMGYIISGTTNDGTFLEVRDFDTAAGSDPDYFLDTPPSVNPGGAWNDGAALPLTATRTFYPGSSSAATLLKTPLWYAAKWGGFDDYNNNQIPDLPNEWDKDGDGIPDSYFYVQNPLMLEEQLNRSFADILRRSASGTAASVISHTRSGEGAVYQAVFYPEFKDSLGNTVNWVGELHALFVDSQGNMREDTDGDAKLDVDPGLGNTDRIIVFDGTMVYKYLDSEGDSILTDSDTPEFTGGINDIKFLWSSSSFLNEMSNSEAGSQRIYDQATSNRYVFTFIDKDNDMVADPNEQIDFVSEVPPASADLTDTAKIFPYLTLFSTFEDEPSITYNSVSTTINTFRSDPNQFQDFLINQSYRVVNYIRGVDQSGFTSSTTPAYYIPEFRSRKVDYDDDGTMETWRMGDVVYSTPTEVGRPAENYHLLYRDTSYAAFASHYKDRRHVIYAGGNDGMFHAFNAGFYDPATTSFKKKLTVQKEYELGSELWAYIPYNLLPHLYWLTEKNYPHVYFCDAKPKVFDAKVFPDGTHYNDTDSDPDWGTLLVAGMRLGGGQITADMNKTDGNTVNSGVDRTMSSAFFILDVTDPETAPEVIAELRFEGLGYTTCYPAVIPMKDKDIAGDGSINGNDWYLVFGSGPSSSGGSAAGNTDSDALPGALSHQSAKLYVVDLKELVLNGNLKILDSTGTLVSAPTTSPSHDYYQSLDPNSFVSDPVSVDFNLDFNADAVYFGTVSGDNVNGWGGKLRRIVINNNTDTGDWVGDSTLMDLDSVLYGQPVTAALTAAIESSGMRWLFWGTGRFFVRADASTVDTQSYYGIKEPFSFSDTNSNGVFDDGESITGWTWGSVTRAGLINESNAVVYDDKSIQNVTVAGSPVATWDDLIDEVDKAGGWYMDFATQRERNIGQATLLGELLTFTTYIPSEDICSFEGESNLYGVYYKTGSAYYKAVMGSILHDTNSNSTADEGELESIKKVSLGQGLAVTPNIHVGEEEGSKAFVQTSTGAIKVVEQINPGKTKSGVISWQER
ncbi:MAG: discoidin domain-containing protein [Pseudomonadota bacterium]